jgi:O-antigen ligase
MSYTTSSLKFNINNKSLFSTLISLLFFFIFYQQVMVVNIGGSFKIYELIAVIFLMFYFVGKKYIYGKHSFLLFLFFVISPVCSIIYYYIGLDASDYYKHFPEALEVTRFNIYFIPILVLIYYLFTWVSINYIIGSRWVYENKYKLVKIFIFSGTLVSLYSLYGLFFVYYLGFPDVVPSFVDYRNSTPVFQIRPAGFSAEPSNYVVMLSWMLLFLLFIPNLYRRKKRWILIFINGLVLILTLSSAIVAFLGVIGIYYAFFKGFFQFIKFLFILLLLLIATYFWIGNYVDINFLQYTFYEKILELFTPPETVLSSGQIRSYTSWLGFELFKDNPIFGVGGGNSYFFLYNYEKNIPVENLGFSLTHSIAPMSIYTKVLSELGIFGFVFMVLFLVYALITFSKFHKMNEFMKIGFMGVLMTSGFFFSIYPVYSLFIWINIALCLNVVYFEKSNI